MGKRTWMTGLLLALFVFFGSSLSLADERSGGPVSMEVSSIYGEIGKIGSYIPIRVRLYGQSEAPFSGSVCVRTLETGTDGNEEVYEYEYPVSVNTAETKVENICVPLGQKSNEIYVCLKASDGKELMGKTMQFNISREMGRLLIGTLSDQAERIRYLGDVNLDYGMVRSVLIPLEQDSFPEDTRGLEMLDILIVNDFDSAALTGKQQKAILQWAEDGGILLFGTGGHVQKTVGAFQEEFSGMSYDTPEVRSVSMGAEYSKETPWDSSVDMVCTEISVPGGKAVLESDELALLTVKPYGQGKTGFFSFDLSDLEEFVQKNPSYKIRMLTEIVGEENISNLYFYGSYKEDKEYWEAYSLVNSGNADRLPRLSVYMLLIGIYIVMAGPGLYLILKKRELNRYYGMTVTLFSVAASAVIYLVGIGTRFTQEFYTYASIYDVSEETVKEQTYLNIRTPDSRQFSAKAAEGYRVRPLTRSSRYDNVSLVKFNHEKGVGIGLRFDEDGTVIRAGRSRAFEPRFFKMDRETENPFGSAISSDLEYFDGKLSGYVSNGFSFPLENAAIFFYGQILPLGNLQPGETREFSEEPLLVWPIGLPYLLAENLVGGSKDADASESEYLRAAERTSLYSFFIGQNYETYDPKVRLAAFGPAGSGMEILASNGQSLDGMAVYTSEIEVSNKKNGMIYRSGLVHEPVITSGNGSFYGSTMIMYSAEPLVVEYSLGNDISVEKLSFLSVSEEFFQNPVYSYFKKFTGEAYFYNFEERAYDRVELDQADFSKEELSKYLSSDNTLIVQYIGGESEQAGVSSALPLLMVTGRER